jgi:hypothetical protein
MGTCTADLVKKTHQTKCFLKCPYGVQSIQNHCTFHDRKHWGLYSPVTNMPLPDRCGVIEIMDAAIRPHRRKNEKY